MWLCKQIRVLTHRHTNLFSATSITLVSNAARPKVRAQKCNLSQLSRFPHIWFPLDALKSHVAASCCVMEWKDCNNKAHDPKPPFAIVHILSDEMTASPSCLWPSEHLSWASHEYMHVFTGESSMCVQSLCVWWGVSAVLHGRSLPAVAGVTHCSFWPLTKCCRARLAPELKVTASKTNQTLPPPHPCQLENDRPGHSAQRPFTINGN